MTPDSRIETFTFPDGSIQRVQIVRTAALSDLSFGRPAFSAEAFKRLCELYEKFIARRYRKIFGQVILFYLPDDIAVPERYSEKYGRIIEARAQAAAIFREEISYRRGTLRFLTPECEDLYRQLQERGCLKYISGKQPYLAVLPVAESLGFLSEMKKDAGLRVNGPFFLMDFPDIAAIGDAIGIPIGLSLKDGRIYDPPAFEREALVLHEDGKISIERPVIGDLKIKIGSRFYEDGVSCRIYTRPAHRKTPAGFYDMIISGNRIIAVKEGGKSTVPAGGFVIRTDEKPSFDDPQVTYQGYSDWRFAIQAGNSVLKDGIRNSGFTSPFYDYRKFWQTPFPPSFYPLDYDRARAPRIVLGTDEKGGVILLWFEGAGKFAYEKGVDSCGVSLKEAAEICEQLGICNGVHLDGGGSAQILIGDKRSLKISDQKESDCSENERGIPSGLYIE